MRIFMWHVHGSWMTSFVQGPHEYFVPVLPNRDEFGRGRAQTYEWPASVREITPEDAPEIDPDVIILQRFEEIALAERWVKRRPGRDVPAVYLEHTSPQGRIDEMKHPIADRADLVLVHVTHFNKLFWDAGATPTTVIEHGIVDPGYRYTGDLPRAAVVINEPVRRGRVTGTDLLEKFSRHVPVDLFGMGVAALGGTENLPQSQLHNELPKRRVYLHPYRWTSLGLSLIEAMHLGLPVVALATTEVMEAVPREAGIVSNDLGTLATALERLVADEAEATERGGAAREAALGRFGLKRFLDDWDALLSKVVR